MTAAISEEANEWWTQTASEAVDKLDGIACPHWHLYVVVAYVDVTDAFDVRHQPYPRFPLADFASDPYVASPHAVFDWLPLSDTKACRFDGSKALANLLDDPSFRVVIFRENEHYGPPTNATFTTIL
jgi:hypothetical protein